tara:strand:+ start:136 stop:774 length:639 start_codon:yes stop_codon:yes gene_type:complete
MAVLGKEVVDTVHPEYWPYCEVYYTDLRTYLGETAQASSAATFYSLLTGTFGAYNSTGTKTADTYYTYVDITGSHGAMGTIIFPCVGVEATGFYTIKLTTDGVVEEFRTLSATIEASQRQFLGFAFERADENDASYQGEGKFGLYSFYRDNAGIRRYYSPATLRSVQDSILYGTPVHTFNESLKVEVKCSLAGVADLYYGWGTVLCTSAPNL